MTIERVEQEVSSVLTDLRPALGAVLEHLQAIAPVTRASELQRLLKLDASLAWSVFNAATATDPRVLASLLPGKRAMERFFNAAREQGVSDAVLTRAIGAFNRFQETVRQHAGHRDAFETMVAEMAGPTGEPAAIDPDAKHKRTAFRALSLLWGRQARVNSGTMIARPSLKHPDLLDFILLYGKLGLRQTRRGVTLQSNSQISRTIPSTNSYRPTDAPAFEPLHPPASPDDPVGLLPAYCSVPTPRFNRHVSADGTVTEELIPNAIGAGGDINIFRGYISRRAAKRDPAVLSALAFAAVIDTPVEVCLIDSLMHASTWGVQPPSGKVYSTPITSPLGEYRDSELLPLTAKAIYLGEGVEAAHTPLIPKYVELLNDAIATLGWNPAEFHVFRCRVDHPPVSSRIRLEYPKTEKA